jgi:hypothetical protein
MNKLLCWLGLHKYIKTERDITEEGLIFEKSVCKLCHKFKWDIIGSVGY